MRCALLVSMVLAMNGCGGAATASGPTPATTGATPSVPSAPSDEVLRTVCHAEYVDETSSIFVAVDGSGAPARIIATPTRRIADMGNQIFDLGGALLGVDTGSEVPWDDAEFMAKEHARVEALMGGATVPNDVPPRSCAAWR